MVNLTVCLEADGSASAPWPALHHAGERFVVLGGPGYLATVRIAGNAISTEYAGPTAAADVLERGPTPPRDHRCFYALGPVTSSLRNANFRDDGHESPRESQTLTPWRPAAEADLDGDGVMELTIVERCAHVVPAGCTDHECDELCSALARGGDTKPLPGSETCWALYSHAIPCTP